MCKNIFFPEHRQLMYRAYFQQHVKERFGVGSHDFVRKSIIDIAGYKKLSVLLRSTPTISLSNHFSFRLLNRIMLSVSSSMICFAE